jgi:hypothetical protein
MGQPPQVKLSIRVVAKDGFALVAADNHMVKTPGNSTRGGLAMAAAIIPDIQA